ncbi:MAG TPA: hypothetical protein DCY20_02160, partial [Firmicutes bacterium]|nr:hypothetical protein [Bacillota bacterium]
MLGGFLIGLMMTLTTISDVKLYGIEDNVTLYIGADIPIKAEVNPAEKNDLIQWILNNPTYLNIK